jgi:short-subunit dehydrogenase
MTPTVLITGASSGIGRGLAFEMASRGHDLGLTARRLDVLEQLRQEIHQRHPDRRIELRRLDVTHYDEVPDAIDELAGALDGLDVVVANAGIAGSGPIGHGHAQTDRAIIETNLLGTMATMDAAVALFQRGQERGHIVAISSVAAFRGLPGSAAYSASKAGVAVYADALRTELHGTSIKVTTLSPGYIDTPLNQGLASRPFLISLEKGAALIADKIERSVSATIPSYPWKILSRILPILPTSQIAKRYHKHDSDDTSCTF